MTLAHANDAPGKLAHEAGVFASVVQFNLVALSSRTLTPDKRLEACERLFSAWPALCDRIGRLEAACPIASAAGYEHAAKLKDMAERLAN